MDDLARIVTDVVEGLADRRGDGEVATYIPALARVSPDHLGLAVLTVDGTLATAGDAHVPFSIQSISKVFTLTLALERDGEALWSRVGREPSGDPFNSIVQLESEKGVPRNPFINAGAIVVADALTAGRPAAGAIVDVLDFVRGLGDDPTVRIDAEVAASEEATGHRNRSLAWFMKAFGNLRGDPQAALRTYFQQCAIAMSCSQLARAALYLAHDGTDPLTGDRITSPDRTRRILSLLLTCGHYDASGDFAFRVGLPGKSGVGGGILCVVPGVGTVVAWSPGLTRSGNSFVGTLALEALVDRTGWSVFAPTSALRDPDA